ncbi:MAG: BMP family ABC transporter substrate-binding protein [Eubacterium sp.]|nr:BMP family ABC transporter substrate-binding protein [Eubacterium sp.]
MKRLIPILLVVLMTASVMFTGCANKGGTDFELALITDGASISDKGYNQSAWNGLKAYAEENSVTCRYYQPPLDENGELTKETIAKYIDVAVNNGAKYIVLPGESFAVSAYETAPTYKDVKFILLDAQPHSADDPTLRIQSNVMCVSYDYYQGGFLAGYVSVTEGLKDGEKVIREYNTKLGVLGSAYNEKSTKYTEGYMAGVNYAADEIGVPVTVDYALYNADNLNYDYDFTVEPVYVDISEAKEKTFKVTVVDGLGTGVYTEGENVTISAVTAPEGKVFDHWEVKSDTEGVRDKKVNISSKKESSMNLLVGDCDCTITAVWTDVETVPVEVKTDGAEAVVYNAPKNSDCWIEAPAAMPGYVFFEWKTADERVIEDKYSKGTTVHVGESGVQLYPVYVKSEAPTFTVSVKNGTGSGSYVAGDNVKVVADAPPEGKMFLKWENIDSQGLSTGISMDNEYCYHAEFEMVDRCASIVEKMFDDGAEVVFAGGNEISDSIYTAAHEFDYPVFCFGWGIDEGPKGCCLASVVNDYETGVKAALENYQGASFINCNCSRNGIFVTDKSLEQYTTDKKGNKVENASYSEGYAALYKKLADGEDLKGGKTSLVTVNYWIK